MTAPERIQRRRTAGWTMPDNTIYVGRPSRFGNPFVVDDLHPELRREIRDPAEAVALYRRELLAGRLTHFDPGRGRRLPITPHLIEHTLRGYNLACWCPLDQPCHADVLLELANHPRSAP